MAVAGKPKRGSLTREEVYEILRLAQQECSPAKLGVTIGKRRLTSSKADRVACLKRVIRELIKKKLSEKGIKVAGEK